MVQCNSGIGALRFVVYLRDIGLNQTPILVAAIIIPPLSSSVFYLNLMLPVYMSLLSFWLGTSNRKGRNSTNSISFWLRVIIHTLFGISFLRRSFLDLEMESRRTRSAAFHRSAHNHSEVGDFCDY